MRSGFTPKNTSRAKCAINLASATRDQRGRGEGTRTFPLTYRQACREELTRLCRYAQCPDNLFCSCLLKSVEITKRHLDDERFALCSYTGRVPTPSIADISRAPILLFRSLPALEIRNDRMYRIIINGNLASRSLVLPLR